MPLAESSATEHNDTHDAVLQDNVDSANTVSRIESSDFQILPWSHIQRIMRVGDAEARKWYLCEAKEQKCCSRNRAAKRNLKGQID